MTPATNARDVKTKIVATVNELAYDPSVPGIEPEGAQRVAGRLLGAVGPTLDHLTNNEPWYASRVTWGVIVAGVATIVKPVLGEVFTAEQTVDLVNSAATLAQFAGFAVTLYGRWIARKPLGA